MRKCVELILNSNVRSMYEKAIISEFGLYFTYLAPELVGYSAPRDLHRRAAYSICESWFFIHQDVYHDLFVCS